MTISVATKRKFSLAWIKQQSDLLAYLTKKSRDEEGFRPGLLDLSTKQETSSFLQAQLCHSHKQLPRLHASLFKLRGKGQLSRYPPKKLRKASSPEDTKNIFLPLIGVNPVTIPEPINVMSNQGRYLVKSQTPSLRLRIFSF